MRIRWKLLILLLGLALLPLGLFSWFENRALNRLGRELGARTREALVQRASQQLSRLAIEYGAIIRRERETLTVALRIQAREIERSLAGPVPAEANILWADELDSGAAQPAGMVRSQRHVVRAADGARLPMEVTYEQPAFKVAPGVLRAAVADDVARLTQVVTTYRLLAEGHRRLIHWQYVALNSGVHCSFPGHGGYPVEFDPRRRSWYPHALETGRLVWGLPIVDASTQELMLSLSMPVRGQSGAPVGVTGIDIRLRDLVAPVNVPAAWSRDAQAMIVFPWEHPGRAEPGIVVVAQQSYDETDRRWDTSLELVWLESPNEGQLAALRGDLRAQRASTRQMLYQGRDCLWACGEPDEDGAAVLLIVPYADLVAQAVAAEADIAARTRSQLRTAGVALAVVALMVFLIAFWGSRTVTRPIAQLAHVAQRIAAGDFSARTQIKGRDELGELGQTMNAMIPQLEDRVRMRTSLALAMHVQQGLLPNAPPRVEGLDIAGRSIYCDETGGDYYDFLELAELGPRCVGVAVGDVTGHGIAAALLMATGRALLRSRTRLSGSLAQMMDDINRQLVLDTGDERFMTLAYLMLDAETRTLRWACAGHDAPITYDPATGDFGELEGGGLPLGVSAKWRYEEYGAQMSPDGQVIVIGTDGIWEARAPGGSMFGKDALRDVVRDNAARSAQEISTAVTKAVTAFRGSDPQEDDITLVVIKVQPDNRT